MSNNELFATTLKENHFSLTKSRQRIFQLLSEVESITMRELIYKTNHTIDRASVYRTISLFENLRIIEKIKIGFKYKIELSDLYSYHHHHITCIICHKSKPIHENKQLEKILITQASSLGYKLSKHQIELSGICSVCQKL